MWRKLTIIVVLLCLAGYAAYEQFGKKDQAVQGEQEKSEAAMKEMIASNGIEIGK
ncbi:thiol:disulfide interchange protein, partial [Bacillus thuringiensis]|nr:thiol:disulfide interchange protein [Bacillus thuringiensis]